MSKPTRKDVPRELHTSGSSTIAAEAFETSKAYFLKDRQLASTERDLLTTASSIHDVEKAIIEALDKYRTKTDSSKTRKWLLRASETLCHYGTILDIFIQHHAEFASLAWGALRLVFRNAYQMGKSALNHGETLRLLAKHVYEIATRLPRIKALSLLYPSEQMRLAVDNLYACILQFFIWAYSWCNESKLSHVLHSLTRPYELRYKDLVQQITGFSDEVLEIATVCSQVQIHSMHNTQAIMWESIKSSLKAGGRDRENQQEVLLSALAKIMAYEQEHDKKLDVLRSRIDSLAANAETFHLIQTSSQLNTSQQLSSLQLTQALMTLTLNHEDPGSLLKQHCFFRKRRAASTGLSTNEFWRSNQLSTWSSCQHSSILAVKGVFTLKSAIQDFGIDVLQALTRSSVTTLWALTSIDRPRSKSTMATTTLLQYLVHQILQIKNTVQTEKSLSLRYMQYQSAKTSEEWLQFLIHLLSGLNGHVYLILDLAAVQSSSSSLDGGDFSLIQKLCQLVQSYGSQLGTVKIKILLLAYEAEWDTFIRQDIPRSVVHVRKRPIKRVPGRAKKRIIPRLIMDTGERVRASS